MDRLAAGVQKFRTKVYPRLAERFRELANGQQPEVLFVTCSDSRVDPSLDSAVDNLMTHPCVSDAVTRGELTLHGWVYDIGSGTPIDVREVAA